MMRPLLFMALMGLALSSGAQIRTWQLSLTDSSRNILYIGAYNEIRIIGLPHNAVIKWASAVFEQKKNNLIDVMCTSGVIRADTLTVTQKGKLIFSKVFSTAHIGDPVTRLGNITTSYTTVPALLGYPVLRAPIDSCLLKIRFSVISFQLTLQSRHQDPQIFDINNDRISLDALNAIRQLKPGDKLIFRHIRAVSPDGVIRALNDLTLTIR